MQVPFLSLQDVTAMHGEEIREAALLGVPAVSFFPRKEFLTVDVVLPEQVKEF